MDTEEFEVLETMMFERPPEWGRRVIKKSDGEVMLQTTEDKGKTWQDAPIPDVKLSLPTAITRSISGNSYAGLVLTPRDAMLTRAVAASTKELKSEVVEAIDSGQLITKTNGRYRYRDSNISVHLCGIRTLVRECLAGCKQLLTNRTINR